uniref:(northern house mosquito) hypothetical protein n=1 Tax=Culex pipiens TaxID=7175 RepID=A0A8D8DYN1_CULPI
MLQRCVLRWNHHLHRGHPRVVHLVHLHLGRRMVRGKLMGVVHHVGWRHSAAVVHRSVVAPMAYGVELAATEWGRRGWTHRVHHHARMTAGASNGWGPGST